ncbi:B3 domain-containing transcription factor VRN1 [Linum perenne]
MITSRYPTRRARTMTSASSYANMREIIKLGFSQAQKKSRLSEEYTNFSSITTANDNLALLMVAFCARTESINLRKYHGEHADGRIRILTERLASEFSNRIDSLVATLQVQTGDTWEVRLHRDISGRLWFTEGWTNFFDFYSVANGYLLVFQYIRNSTLNAAIFSSNSSEIAYPIRGVVNEQAEDHSDLDSE